MRCKSHQERPQACRRQLTVPQVNLPRGVALLSSIIVHV